MDSKCVKKLIDEIVFTKSSIYRKAFSNVGKTLSIRDKDLYIGYRAVIAAVSAEQGFIYYEKDDIAVTKDSYHAFIRNLSD